MTTPFTTYLSIKDNYCLAYFGEDINFINKIIKSKSIIEQELPGINLFVIIKDSLNYFNDNKIVSESKMIEYKGKMAFFRELAKEEDLESILSNSKINIF